MELKSLSRKDPQFLNYLLGTFSKTHRALPMKSLNVGSQSETITFRILPIEQLSMPNWWVKWAQIFKLNTFVLVAFPLVAVLLQCEVLQLNFDPLLAVLASLGALFLHAAVNLRNDFRDHVLGLDRVHPESGSRAIQLGWIAAQQALWLSRVFFFMGLLFGLPVVLVFPELLAIVALLALLLIVGMSSFKMGLKYRMLAEWASFLLLGPLLTVGFQVGIGAGYTQQALFLGLVTGALGFFCLQLKNFQQIMVNDQMGFRNSVVALGFEKAKIFLLACWLFTLSLFFAYHLLYSNLIWTLLSASLCLFLFYQFQRRWLRLQSSVGSQIKQVVQRSRVLGYLLMGFWLMEFLVVWLIRELGL